MNPPLRLTTARDAADLLADRFAAQVRQRTGFQGPHPDPRPAGSGFEFGRSTIRYAVVLDPPGSVVVRVKNGAELVAWTLGSDGLWQERRAGFMLAFWGGVIALGVWAIRQFRPSDKAGSALRILLERFARGEIERQEYEQGKSLLQH